MDSVGGLKADVEDQLRKLPAERRGVIGARIALRVLPLIYHWDESKANDVGSELIARVAGKPASETVCFDVYDAARVAGNSLPRPEGYTAFSGAVAMAASEAATAANCSRSMDLVLDSALLAIDLAGDAVYEFEADLDSHGREPKRSFRPDQWVRKRKLLLLEEIATDCRMAPEQAPGTLWRNGAPDLLNAE